VPVEYGAWVLPSLAALESIAARAIEAGGGGEPPAGAAPTVQLRGVRFRYPGGERDVLHDVDLELEGGTSAALVGINGAGKTTLVRLLCGLYPPDGGAVLVDGTDLRELDTRAWQRLLAPMFQESLRIPSTVADNVGVGAIEHLGDRAGIAASLQTAHAVQDADRLLATRYADGSDVSGGQWQRIAIARALFALRHGARVLLLDEPTSNLDTASEERLVRRLLDETRGRATTLLVTHRLALARRTDRIFVVEAGRVVEAGSHDDLVRAGGRYASAFAMQAGLYPLEAADG
jgi:ATP-binding cassette subfamily B protein